MELIRVTVRLEDTQVEAIVAAIITAGLTPEAQRHASPEAAVRQAKALLYAANTLSDDPLRKMKVKI